MSVAHDNVTVLHIDVLLGCRIWLQCSRPCSVFYLAAWLKSGNGHDVTQRAIIDVKSIVLGRNCLRFSPDYHPVADVMAIP